ncbi:MAG: DUF885 domain-containing protein [Polyangiaceae bacterium]|nr:DUF885 domain-containing protein [Polyangiaceae bacterium]
MGQACDPGKRGSVVGLTPALDMRGRLGDIAPVRCHPGRVHAAALAGCLLGACAFDSAPAILPPSAPAAPSVPPFGPLRDRVLSELLDDEPGVARDLGLHEYDGRVAPFSRAAIDAQVARLRAAERDLSAWPAERLTEDEALDRTELSHWVATRLFWWVDRDASRKVPQAYEDAFDVSRYVDRDYAPIAERARRALQQEEAALTEVPHIRENLTPPLPRPVAETAARNFVGYATYLRGDVARVFGGVGDAEQQARFTRANEALAREAEQLGAWLKEQAEHGDESHVLGPERYARLLEAQEAVTMPLDAFERMNEEDLAANRRAYEALAATVKPVPVREADLFATARAMVGDARRFIVEHRIVTLASDDGVIVRETPPYERWNSASIEMSGPFEKARSAFFQLTIPDKAWPEAKRAEYLGSVGDLLGTTLHEVFPGHFVQGRWAERAPTRVQKAFSNYAFVEGWAHYGEQMMIDEGFAQADPANRLAMLSGALLRNCRFAASIGIHVKGMTVEQAENRFVRDCHQDRPTAHEQAVRGTFDPGYFAYTLGKLQILALRAEARARLGSAFSLERFHDALLAHGAPPLAVIRDRVLRDIGAGTP